MGRCSGGAIVGRVIIRGWWGSGGRSSGVKRRRAEWREGGTGVGGGFGGGRMDLNAW